MRRSDCRTHAAVFALVFSTCAAASPEEKGAPQPLGSAAWPVRSRRRRANSIVAKHDGNLRQHLLTSADPASGDYSTFACTVEQVRLRLSSRCFPGREMARHFLERREPTANANAVKMKKHCETIAKDADKLASDAEKAADYHTMRAKELEGK